MSLVAALNALIALDQGARDAYRAARDRFGDPADAEAVRRFSGDHERHVQALAQHVRDLGGVPAEPSGARGALASAPTRAVGLLLGPSAVLRRLKTESDARFDAYDAALRRDDLSPDL